jgi:hypothetical protein
MKSSEHMKKELCPNEIIYLNTIQWQETTESHATQNLFTQANKCTHSYLLTRLEFFILQA